MASEDPTRSFKLCVKSYLWIIVPDGGPSFLTPISARRLCIRILDNGGHLPGAHDGPIIIDADFIDGKELKEFEEEVRNLPEEEGDAG